MKKKKARLGKPIHSWRELRSYQCFVTPWFRLRKSLNLLRLIVILAYAAWHFTASPPTVMYVIVLVAFFASTFLDIFCFDNWDQRVYISDRDVVIKADSLTLTYRWAHIQQIQGMSENALLITFIDGSTVILKGMTAVDELIAEMNHRVHPEYGENT